MQKKMHKIIVHVPLMMYWNNKVFTYVRNNKEISFNLCQINLKITSHVHRQNYLINKNSLIPIKPKYKPKHIHISFVNLLQLYSRTMLFPST